MLVTYARYLTVTGDSATASATVMAALDDAQGLLEEKLQRQLAEGSRTERMYPDPEGRLYPKVTPLVTAPDGYRIDGDMLLSAGPFPGWTDFVSPLPYVDLTYTGGYLERTANPSASNRLPVHVERDLCWAAYRLCHRAHDIANREHRPTLAVNGDARVQFETLQHKVGVGADVDDVWSRTTLRLGRVGRRV